MFYFHTAKMQEFVPNQILSAINLWDDIIGWEQELMGIEDVRPSQVNNHIFAISPEGSYMWATDYCIGFVYTYLNNILLKENVMANKDNAWGPAHEIGHIIRLLSTGRAVRNHRTICSLTTFCTNWGNIAPEEVN